MAKAAVPLELSFPLPKAPETNIQLHLTISTNSVILFLTTVINSDNSTPVPLGSFVHALVDQRNPRQTLSTPICTHESSLEFATRLAKLIARKTGRPAYVGSSMSFASAGMGGTVDEEMEGFKKVVEVVLKAVSSSNETQATNGVNI